jgi:hypothetical protein
VRSGKGGGRLIRLMLTHGYCSCQDKVEMKLEVIGGSRLRGGKALPLMHGYYLTRLIEKSLLAKFMKDKAPCWTCRKGRDWVSRRADRDIGVPGEAAAQSGGYHWTKG